MMHLSLMFDARARTGPGSRSRGKTPSKSTISRIRRAQKKLAELGEVDVLTAGDNDVCPVCEAISEDGPYDLDTAEDLIPAHPFCRCAFVPAGTLGDALPWWDFDPDQPRDPHGRWTFAGGPSGERWQSVAEEARRRVLEGNKQIGADSTKLRRNLDSAMRDLEQHQDARDWYDRHRALAKELFGELEPLFERFLAATSPGNRGVQNVREALRAMQHHMLGKTFDENYHIATKYPEGTLANLKRVQTGEEMRGGKVPDFDHALRGDVNAVPGDIWMGRLMFKTLHEKTLAPAEKNKAGFYIAKTGTLTTGQHKVLNEVVSTFAKKMGWQPREMQAALWATEIARSEYGPGAKPWDYQQYLLKRAAGIRALIANKWVGKIEDAPSNLERLAQAYENGAALFALIGVMHEQSPNIGDYNPYHAPAGSPEGGQFTSGEGVGAGSAGGGIESLVQHISSDPPFDPKVVDVGGDEWNRQTALRLEREYQNAKPALERLAEGAVGGSVKTTYPSEWKVVPHPDFPEESFALLNVSGDYAMTESGQHVMEYGSEEEAKSGIKNYATEQGQSEEEADEAEYIPQSWDEINDTKQEEIFNDWKEKTHDQYLADEIQNWQENGDAMDDTKGTLAYYLDNHKGHENNQYAFDALNELRDERKDDGEQEIPFTNEQLMDAMSFSYETGYQGMKDVEIDWHDDKLGLPKGWVEEEPMLPGMKIEPIPPSSKLTKEMREDIETKLIKAFNNEADNKVSDTEPPEYLSENIEEYQDQAWDSKSDKGKFKWAKDNGHIQEPESESLSDVPKTLYKMPDKIDPLGENDKSRDYQLTKLLAEKMSVGRAADVMMQRGVFKDRANAVRAAHDFDNRLWKAWKGDSGSTDGMILQAATAAELGGRFRNKQGTPFDARDLEDAGYKQQAKERFGSAGGWAGLLAYVRAKWETSQYLLDKANKPEVDVYRGILLKDKGREEEMKIPQSGYNFPFHFTRLPEIPLNRSGAQSTTADISVANTWKGVGASASGFKPEDDRVVFRMRVPRTAVLSLPAYGQNVYGEHEVVLAGTAWKKWDAWLHHAPDFKEFSMKDALEMK